MTQAVSYEVRHNSPTGVVFYGGAREMWRYQGHECVISGPYETGKTLPSLHKINALLLKYPGARALMVRKTYKSLINSATVTYEKKVLEYPPDDFKCPIRKLGKSRPDWYDYPNGARLVLGGMDNPDKILSSEWDYIYVNQAEELSLDEWEKLTGRCTGRAGNAPYSQIIGDCNPGPPSHWIKHRPSLKMFVSRHEDNPTLFDQVTGAITKQGQRTMSILDALTGVRYKRGRLGLWAGAEGQVFEEWDDTVHLIDWFKPLPDWPRYRSVDFGYTNPFVCKWWAIDPDGRAYSYREIYETKRLVEDLAKEIVALSEGERITETVADHDAEGRATLQRHGVPTVAADKSVLTGIEAVQKRLRIQGDGKPRLFEMRDSLVRMDQDLAQRRKPTCTAEEYPGYIWQPVSEGRAAKEEPVKDGDHGIDTTRYMIMRLDNRVVSYGVSASI